MDFTGIFNENGYFSDSFFATGMASEIADPVARWAEGGEASPVTRLTRLAAVYPSLVEALRGANDPEVRREARGETTRSVMEALGYPYHRMTLDISVGQAIPVVGRVAGTDGRDLAWVLEAPTPAKGEAHADPLGQSFDLAQFPDDDRADAATDEVIEVLLGRGIYDLRLPPRHVLVLGVSQAVLNSRDRWHRHAVLRFDLEEIFERREDATLEAMACLVSREALAPETGVPLIERLAEEAQRYANQVTTSLKETVRHAIEILGQEVLEVTCGKYPQGHPRAGVWIRDEDLTLEALRMIYRLLFLFYAEANPKMGIVDLRDRDYASGYSLEGLRALETRALRPQEEKTGTYLWDSLTRLVHLMFEGTGDLSPLKTFSIKGARVALLDPAATPILSNPNVRLRNVAVQKIIRLLSLKTGKSGTGRISYAQLGIGQLGAVYETLISFTGFVCKQDMIQILPKEAEGAEGEGSEDSDDDLVDEEVDDADAEDDHYRRDDTKGLDKPAPAWFVPRTRAKDFARERIVYAGPEPLIYPEGSFVYRLSGRDRQKSASFYTPEPLARLLVKHALEERCKGLTADDLLELKILEPAMGSAAFLAETVNQLADRYIELKQAETGRTIAQEDWYLERQKVRAYIADRKTYGVDLNPIAMELAQVTLWLNGLHASDFSPWFPHQLHAGNSLVGARKAAYAPAALTTRTRGFRWLDQPPMEIGWKGTRPEDHVWQFLLPAPGMVGFEKDKDIKPIAGAEQERIKDWRRAGWEKPLTGDELRLAQRLNRVIDDLFEVAADEIEASRHAFDDPITLWPDKAMPGTPGLDHRRKAQVLRVLRGEDHVGNTLPYKRLKTAMDAWCALWCWPLDQVDRLPSRALFLNSLKVILEGGFVGDKEDDAPLVEESQGDLFAAVTPEEAERIARVHRGLYGNCTYESPIPVVATLSERCHSPTTLSSSA